jgi:polyisoprenoid-binding protein YceI
VTTVERHLRDAPAPAPSSWLALDGGRDIRLSPDNARLTFEVRWLGGWWVRGTFAELDGLVRLPADGAGVATLEVVVAAASVRTGIALRDRHLRSADYLDATRHPEIVFRASSARPRSSRLLVPGRLALRGVERPEQMEIVPDVRDGSGHAFMGTICIRREAYGVGIPGGLKRLDPRFQAVGSEVRVQAVVRVPSAAR